MEPDTSRLQTPPAAGTRLGEFLLEEEIGRGGMGVVYRAWQGSLEREVAVKLLRDSALAEPALAARFRTEALAAAGLQHPGIVRVHGAGTADGVHYYSMDYVEGRSVSEVVRAEGSLPPRRAAELAAEMADAMQHAHEMGVVHRDVKPSNVLVDLHGRARVLDFGLARREGSQALTLTGEVLGTPGYMPPEQARGKRGASPAADIFGIGAVLYFMLTGRAPFAGDSTSDLLRLTAEGVVTAPRKWNRHTPRDLQTICLKCLRREPADRYRSAAELAADLRRWLAGDSIAARPLPAWRRGFDWLRRHPRAAALLLLLTAGLTSGTLWLRHQWTQVWEHDVICSYVLRTTDGFEPLFPLKPHEWYRRNQSVSLVRRGTRGPVLRMEIIDGTGAPSPGKLEPPFYEVIGGLPAHRQPQRIDFEYDETGRLMEETLRDTQGGVLSRTRWVYPKDAPAGPATARLDYFDALAGPLNTGTSTLSARLYAGEGGEWTRVEYLDAAGQPSQAHHGVFGARTSRPGGAPSRVLEFLDASGQPMNNSDGVARTEEIWNAGRTRLERRTFDKTGQPASTGGYHLLVEINDAHGNIAGRAYFQNDGTTPAPARNPTAHGASRLTYTHDEHGRALTITASGFDPAKEGYASKTDTRTWYESGDRRYSSVTTFHDAAGLPCRHRYGYLRAENEHDRVFRAVRLLYRGYDPAKHGYANEHITYTWGEGLRPMRAVWTFSDAAGQPARHPKGYLEQDEEYDARGRLLKITRNGCDGSKGYAKRVDLRHYASPDAVNDSGQTFEYYDATGRRVEVTE